MISKTLYKYKRDNGGVTVSVNKPEDRGYTEMLRLIADEGKMLTQDGVKLFSCIDVDTADSWYEVNETECEGVYDETQES
jgi:hypothetical protein